MRHDDIDPVIASSGTRSASFNLSANVQREPAPDHTLSGERFETKIRLQRSATALDPALDHSLLSLFEMVYAFVVTSLRAAENRDHCCSFGVMDIS